MSNSETRDSGSLFLVQNMGLLWKVGTQIKLYCFLALSRITLMPFPCAHYQPTFLVQHVK